MALFRVKPGHTHTHTHTHAHAHAHTRYVSGQHEIWTPQGGDGGQDVELTCVFKRDAHLWGAHGPRVITVILLVERLQTETIVI